MKKLFFTILALVSFNSFALTCDFDIMVKEVGKEAIWQSINDHKIPVGNNSWGSASTMKLNSGYYLSTYVTEGGNFVAFLLKSKPVLNGDDQRIGEIVIGNILSIPQISLFNHFGTTSNDQGSFTINCLN